MKNGQVPVQTEEEITRKDVLKPLGMGGIGVLVANIVGLFLIAAHRGQAYGLPPESQQLLAEVPDILYTAGMMSAVFLGVVGLFVAGFGFWLSLEYIEQHSQVRNEGDAAE